MVATTVWDGLYEVPVPETSPAGTAVFSYSGGGNFGYSMTGTDTVLSINRFAFSFKSSDFSTFPSGTATILYDRSVTTAARLATLPYDGKCAFTDSLFYVGNQVHDLRGNLLFTAGFPSSARVFGDRAVDVVGTSGTWVASVYDALSGRLIGSVDTAVAATGSPPHCGFALSADRLTLLPDSYNKAIIIDTQTMTILATVNVGTTEASGYTNGGVNRVAAWGSLAAVVNMGSNNVTIIDTSTGSVKRTIAVGTRPVGISIYRGIAAVANSGADSVSLIDISSGATVRSFAVQSLSAYFMAFHGARLVTSTYGVVGKPFAYGYASGQSGALTTNLWNGATEQPVSSITTL